MAEEPSAPKPKKKRNLKGLLKVLTILVACVTALAGTWLVLERLDQPQKASTASTNQVAEAGQEAEASAGGHGGGGHGSPAAKTKLPPDITVPITDSPIDALAAPSKYTDAAVPRVLLANVTQIKRQEIIATLADKGGKKHAVTEIFLTSNDTASLIARMNETQPALHNRVKEYLESKTSKQVRDGTFMIQFKVELERMCKEVLGPSFVKDIIVAEFIAE